MTISSPTPPPRSRRRIVFTITVLTLALGWWFWPIKIDRRFVGHWQKPAENRRPLEWTFNESGVFEGEWQLYPVQRWSVQGNRLTLSPMLHWRNIDAFLYDLKRHALPLSNSYTIRSVSENGFELEAGSATYHFERMHENP